MKILILFPILFFAFVFFNTTLNNNLAEQKYDSNIINKRIWRIQQNDYFGPKTGIFLRDLFRHYFNNNRFDEIVELLDNIFIDRLDCNSIIQEMFKKDKTITNLLIDSKCKYNRRILNNIDTSYLNTIEKELKNNPETQICRKYIEQAYNNIDTDLMKTIYKTNCQYLLSLNCYYFYIFLNGDTLKAGCYDKIGRIHYSLIDVYNCDTVYNDNGKLRCDYGDSARFGNEFQTDTYLTQIKNF